MTDDMKKEHEARMIWLNEGNLRHLAVLTAALSIIEWRMSLPSNKKLEVMN